VKFFTKKHIFLLFFVAFALFSVNSFAQLINLDLLENESVLKDLKSKCTKENLLGEGGYKKAYKCIFDEKESVILAFNNTKENIKEYFDNNLMFYNKFTEEQLEANNLVPAFAYSAKEMFLVIKFIGKDFIDTRMQDLGKKYGNKEFCFDEYFDFLDEYVEKYIDIFLDVVKALEFLHKNKIIHCDVKPDNVLVKYDDIKERYVGYLSDFDFVKYNENGSIFTKKRTGTQDFYAQELTITRRYKKMQGNNQGNNNDRYFLYSKYIDNYALGEFILDTFFSKTFTNKKFENICKNKDIYLNYLNKYLQHLFKLIFEYYHKKENITIDCNIKIYSDMFYEDVNRLIKLFYKDKKAFDDECVPAGKIKVIYMSKMAKLVFVLMQYKPQDRFKLKFLIEELNKIKELIEYLKDNSELEENFEI